MATDEASRIDVRIVRPIDDGGVADVMHAVARFPDGAEREVAVKRLKPEKAGSARHVRMFEDEGELAVRLKHPNLVRVLAMAKYEGLPCQVMEFVDGSNLWMLLRRTRLAGKRLPRPMAIEIVRQVLRGLEFAHELTDSKGRHVRIIHRDVSPENILLSRDGRVKLTDFGMSTARTHSESIKPGTVRGKYGYLAPETLRGKTVDRRIDIFATGVVLWECLATRRLFPVKSIKSAARHILKNEIPHLSKVNPKIDPELDRIAAKALARERRDRYCTAGAFADDLDAYMETNRMVVARSKISQLVRWVCSESDTEERDAVE